MSLNVSESWARYITSTVEEINSGMKRSSHFCDVAVEAITYELRHSFDSCDISLLLSPHL